VKRSFSEISSKNDEGKLLIMALSRLTCTIWTDKTPDECVAILADMAESMDW
jgi:hypothetical protein